VQVETKPNPRLSDRQCRNQSKDETRLTGKVVLDAMGSGPCAAPGRLTERGSRARFWNKGDPWLANRKRLEPELKRCGWRGDGDRGIELVEAAEVIGMGELVMNSVRRKKKSSLRIGSKLVNEGLRRRISFLLETRGAAMATAKMVYRHAAWCGSSCFGRANPH